MLSAIQNRQAVRKFTNAPVNSNDIDELINAFQASPCGMHQTDVMKGIVIESPDLRAEIEKLLITIVTVPHYFLQLLLKRIVILASATLQPLLKTLCYKQQN